MRKNNEYTNCHDYTSHYIVEFAVNCPLKVAAENYRKNLNGSKEYWEKLNSVSKLPSFDQTKCAELPVPALVLFCTQGGSLQHSILQHSMIVYDTDSWIGANNLGALGAPDEHVNKYVNVSERVYQYREQGGWNGKKFHCIYGDEYKMYYIPFDINDDGYRYNRNMISGDRDTGCGCIVC